ncbi:cell division protein FtsK [Bacillus toyonensis]|uniref:FtsK/SpoIIIE domain-containing protein n=1 Tax=Bacillus toyonensis TaxID=155322 RepID=UPI000BFD9FB8|nr:FtsK/SpoIIIE domain-containing protein [Bacillus toyonensis]PHE64375.1 cell division protein FtsK [Bacillus toyonensis]
MSFNSNDFVSRDSLEREKQDRLDRQNPPSVEHGQEDLFAGLDVDSLFNDAGSNTPTGGGSGNSFDSFGSTPQTPPPMGGMNNQNPIGGINPMGGMQNPMGMNPMNPMQQPKEHKKAEDVLWDGMKKSGLGVFSFTREVVNSFKGLDPIFWSKYGAVLFKTSGIASVALFGTVMLGVDTLNLMVGSGLSTIVGVLVLTFNNGKARHMKEEINFPNNNETFDINKIEDDNSFAPNQNDPFQNMFDDNNAFDEPKPIVNLVKDDIEEDDEFANDDEDEFAWDEDEDEEDEWEEEDPFDKFVPVTEQESDVSTVLTEVDEVPAGMYTRAFLYENYLKVLTKMTPEYSESIDLTEEDDEWDVYGVLVREAQEQMGLDTSDEYEDDLSEILSVEKRLLTIKIEATRPQKLSNSKVADFDRELTSLVAVEKGEYVDGRYTKTIVAGKKLYITIFLGETATVSVKDAIIKEKDFFLDQSNRIPVVLGFDHMGRTIKVDLFNIESILTAGMPRGGKSYAVKTALSQVIQFSSPRDVIFYFADVKGALSDWYEFKMPHVKRFEGTPEGVLNMLTAITEMEGKRRERIFKDAGALNFKQYKKMHPEADMPLIYVVIDEMTTLSQQFSNEDQKKYKERLINVVTRMPSFGVKLWGIPHVLKNEIIPKTVSDTIDCRISVKGDSDHIEATTGAKPKNFTFKLSNVGDCAVRMPIVSSDVFFMHSFIIAMSDEGISRVLDYQAKLWEKLDPESAKDSFATMEANKGKHKVLLDKTGISDIKFDKDGAF